MIRKILIMACFITVALFANKYSMAQALMADRTSIQTLPGLVEMVNLTVVGGESVISWDALVIEGNDVIDVELLNLSGSTFDIESFSSLDNQRNKKLKIKALIRGFARVLIRACVLLNNVPTWVQIVIMVVVEMVPSPQDILVLEQAGSLVDLLAIKED